MAKVSNPVWPKGSKQSGFSNTSESQSDDDDNSTTSVGKAFKDKVITSVGDRVKEKIQEDNDSTTSSGINRIIDVIMDFLKGS